MLLAATLAFLAQAAPPAKSTSSDVLLVSFRAEAVDGVDELVVKDGAWSIEHLEWDPIRGADVSIRAPLPADTGQRVVVRARQGRPAVQVVQQPRADNGRELRVRIDDGPHSGAAPLSFELWAVPWKSAPRPCDVLVVTIDSLRPDHLACYGYARPTSPNLDAFAASAVKYTRAHSTSCFTPPAHGSLFTSRQVGDHGLRAWNALPEEQLTLAEILAANGYRTGASVNLTLLSQNGLGQGFEWRREGEREAREIVDDALEFVRGGDDRPWFLWLHLYDVHRPYGREGDWKERFGAATRRGVGDGEDDYNLLPEQVKERALTPADLAYISDRYDGGIEYADAQLAPLLAELSSAAREKKTLVVITADHGESLLDHGERLFSHDPYLISAVTRIPMLVRYPGGRTAGSVREDPTSLIDVAPTVVDLVGIEKPPTYQGRSLLELENGGKWPDRELYQECWGWTRQAAARTNEWLAVRDVDAGTTRVFSLADDPGETKPLAGELPSTARALGEKLAAFAARPGAGEKQDTRLDPRLEEQLRRLGYTDR